jgi:hypothetical protein
VEKKMKNNVIFLVSVFAFGGFLGQAEEMPSVATCAIDIAYGGEGAGITATADIAFVEGSVAPQVLTFYLHGELWVDQVTFDGEPVEVIQDSVFYPSDYSLVARRSRIELPGHRLPKQLSIRYSGKFNRSSARSPSDYMRVDDEGIFLRSYGYSVWFPVFLESREDAEPIDFDLTVRTPEDLVAVATGERLSETVEDGVRISRWRSVQDDIFNIQLTARPFEHLVDHGSHLYHLRDTDSRASAGKILEFSSRLGEFFRSNYADRGEGGQLHVVQMPKYGDISSGNMVGISDDVWRGFDPASYSGRTLAHELVHAYVQIPVSRDSELYALIIEGFPSFFHLPAMAAIVGEDFYTEILARTENGYLERRQSGRDRRGRPLPIEKPLLALTADDIGTYKDRFVLNDRARLFCNWLRDRMGVDEFGKFTRELFSKESLDTEGLVATIEAYLADSGDDVSRWLGTTDFPEQFRLSRSGVE